MIKILVPNYCEPVSLMTLRVDVQKTRRRNLVSDLNDVLCSVSLEFNLMSKQHY